MRSSYYIHDPCVDENNFCRFRCVVNDGPYNQLSVNCVHCSSVTACCYAKRAFHSRVIIPIPIIVQKLLSFPWEFPFPCTRVVSTLHYEFFYLLSCLLVSLASYLQQRDDLSITIRLTSANKFSRLFSCTRKYQTFIFHALFHCQAFIRLFLYFV